ncbi:MAG: endo-1,4-beta-xylanase [Anaerolineae bacterium]
MRRIVLIGIVLASLLTACTSGTIRQLIAGGEPSAAEPSWDCPEQIDAGDYTPIDPPLRDLADARGIYIGGAVEPQHINCDPTYAEVLGREFNILVSENAFKLWAIHPTEDQYAFQGTDAIVEFAEAHGMKVRGHTLLWYRYMPDWIENATFTPEQWDEVIHDHIATVVGRYKGRVAYWDVLNEAVSDSVRQVLRQTNWSDGLGPDFVDKVFIWAHEADPDALLFYNDYGAEGLGRKSDRVYDLVKDMLERDVPIHGVGLQLHLAIGEAPKLENVQRNIERLGELGLQVHITELDIRLPDDASDALFQTQAEMYRDYLEVCLAAENCTAFVMWGFTDRYSWIPSFKPGFDHALIFDRNYRAKPAYFALRDAFNVP